MVEEVFRRIALRLVFGFLWLGRDTMTTATIIRKPFNRGGLLTLSEVQSIIIMAGNITTCRQTWRRSSRKSSILQASVKLQH